MKAIFHTTMGDIVVELYADEAPITVGNFVGLAEGTIPWEDPITGETKEGVPFYDGILFHRVIPDFMVQVGDPKTRADRPDWGTGGPGYRFDDEPSALKLKHDQPGVLSMANAGPGTNGSQIFVTEVETGWLDGKHAVFGRIIDGLDVVKSIARVKTGRGDRPVEPIAIKQLEIQRG